MDMLATLRLFQRVVELGSISGAGRALGLSTTAASRQIQELEAALKARLLNRTTRSVAATEAGQHLFDRVGPLLEDLEAALRSAGDEPGQPAGTLRVVARRSFGILHVAPALAGFHARFPHVSVELTLTEVMDLRPSSGVDVVIRLGRPDEKSLVSTCLASDRRVLCASPAYLARVAPPVIPADCARHACLAYHREYEPALWVFEERGRRREVAVSGPLRSNSGEVLRRAALDGLGLALLPEWMVAGDVEAGRLQLCLPALRAYPAGYQAEIYAVHARGEFVPTKITAFVTHLEHFPRQLARE
ncbi:MAG: LysR family transcriptional regulator [Acetobacteraceae bacterium]